MGRWLACPSLRLLLLLGVLSGQGAFARKCYQYSWLGPDSVGRFKQSEQLWHDTVSGSLTDEYTLGLGNRTCEKYPKPKPIPCINPFVLTSDGRVPNATELEQVYGRNVTCIPGKGEVCAVVIFYFDDAVYNISAYCTRVSEDGDAITGSPSTCISAQKGAYVNQVCICNPKKELCNDNINTANVKGINQAAWLLLVSLTIIVPQKIVW